ncbi:unnamed protein product [Dovyalis caffra]|uniref:Uncharacterized protein n=1 Tax=Dovyalis caffra TaxID=77055 RepID=A0AAV1SB79_9ROSI|nr:unnamed protein product [Dovyalis caffra]
MATLESCLALASRQYLVEGQIVAMVASSTDTAFTRRIVTLQKQRNLQQRLCLGLLNSFSMGISQVKGPHEQLKPAA